MGKPGAVVVSAGSYSMGSRCVLLLEQRRGGPEERSRSHDPEAAQTQLQASEEAAARACDDHGPQHRATQPQQPVASMVGYGEHCEDHSGERLAGLDQGAGRIGQSPPGHFARTRRGHVGHAPLGGQ
ncbi:hypothetical protein OF385_01890 [Glutamicibacter sp. JL.03c]|uniref:hypothetical protein n=1 Tax=Glutamicibacter sp. JL.03c TaxID=2984842 RepID=UPI0021F79390|nr:hypothetical protein [Glutamicibacter sp. JL.03c]UYQ77950.1 hypothetical protein OF385_01890 [Glutamicibacter sp. JL.03c]